MREKKQSRGRSTTTGEDNRETTEKPISPKDIKVTVLGTDTRKKQPR